MVIQAGLEMVIAMMKITMLAAFLIMATVVAQMSIHTFVLNANALAREDVLCQIMLEMVFVMMKTTMQAAILMMETVVAQMSILNCV